MTSPREQLREEILKKAVVHGKVILSPGKEADYYMWIFAESRSILSPPHWLAK
jgi:orotate phosphoribosyltransferase